MSTELSEPLPLQRRFVTPNAGETLEGLADRGRLKPGFAGDVERPAHDVPGGGLRYVGSAIGIDTVLVNSFADGAYADARAGVICGSAAGVAH
ncbi:MAG: hypothetical protein U1C74_08190 [Phenylobacterium sp.]|nr:hypothetical protein [Phenylobacterium sp.]